MPAPTPAPRGFCFFPFGQKRFKKQDKHRLKAKVFCCFEPKSQIFLLLAKIFARTKNFGQLGFKIAGSAAAEGRHLLLEDSGGLRQAGEPCVCYTQSYSSASMARTQAAGGCLGLQLKRCQVVSSRQPQAEPRERLGTTAL